MLEVKLPYLSYHRLLADSIDKSTTSELKKDDYSFIVCYGAFEDDEYETVNKNSCIIDLTKGIEEVFSKFSATSRNEVRRADKINLLKFHSSISAFNFDEFYAFHTQCEHDRGWFPIPPEELKNSVVFSASYDGQLIAGMSCYTHHNRMRIGRIFSNKRSNKNEAINNLVYGVASKRIVLELCKYGIENGYISLDMGGVDMSDSVKSGITQFKLSLGGDVVPVKLGRYKKETFEKAELLIKNNGWDLT